MTAQYYQAPAGLLNEKVILVTGAGDGIGYQIAKTYATFGATVLLLGKTVKKLEKCFDDIIALEGAEPAIIPLDLKGATSQHYRDMAMTIQQQFGRLDGVVHNAAFLGHLSAFRDIPEQEWHDVMQINLTAPMIMTQALLPVLSLSPAASVIFTTSSVGHHGRAFWGSYAISKFGTEGMMQVLADEYKKSTLRFNAVNPGATRTKMRASAYPAEDASNLKGPEDIMPAYLYLMGDESIGVNGQRIDCQPK